MKEFIDNKLYDTDTASKLCSNNHNSEYNTTSEALYRTSNGAFFTYTYTVHKNGNVQANSIKVLPKKEAQEYYARYNGDISKWKEVFGEDVEKA